MSSQQSDFQQLKTMDPDRYDCHNHWYRRRTALTPRDPDKPWQMNRKSFKEIKRRVHKRQRRTARFDIMAE